MTRANPTHGRRALAATVIVLAGWLSGARCSLAPRLAILSPADLSQADTSGSVPVEIDLGASLGAGGSVQASLVRGIDGGVRSIASVALSVSGASATASLGPANLVPGRNSLFVSVDRDGDGRPDATASATFSWEPHIEGSPPGTKTWSMRGRRRNTSAHSFKANSTVSGLE